MRGVGLALLVVLGAVGCAPRTLFERALAAHGGPCAALTRVSTVQMLAGYPGTWSSRMTFAPPDRYAWSYDTTGDPYHYLFDGQVVRAFVGTSLVSEDTEATAPLRSHARFTAVMLLDALRAPGVTIGPTPDGEALAGGERALTIAFPGDVERYRLIVGAGDRATEVEGPLEFPGLGRGRVTANLSDYGAVGGCLLPRHIRYAMDGKVFAEEQVTAYCPAPNGLPDESFRSPASLPRCP